MPMRRTSSVVLLLLLALSACAGAPAPAAPPGVPFRLVRNKVLVPVRVNGSRPLALILDSGMGMEGVILFRPRLRDSLGAARFHEAVMAGAGGGAPSRSFFADSLPLDIGPVRLSNQRVVVLADSAMALGRADGVIGSSLLGRFAVELDYGRRTMTLHDRAGFRPAPGWTVVPIALGERNLPFLEISAVVVPRGPALSLLAYVDCASSETIEFLTGPGAKVAAPEGAAEVVLGRGLSGDITGRRATIPRLAIGGHELRDVRAAFTPAAVRSRVEGADAVLANGVLCRFDVIFDYARQRLLLRPNACVPDAMD